MTDLPGIRSLRPFCTMCRLRQGISIRRWSDHWSKHAGAESDGTSRTGGIRTSWGQKAGSATTVWIDDAGRQSDPPLRRSQLIGQQSMAMTLTVVCLAFVVFAISHLIHRMLDRLRMADWEVDWAIAEPRWSGRRT